jgi:hypothetical protein
MLAAMRETAHHAMLVGLVALAGGACGYGDGEGLYLDYSQFESPADCTSERCALATGTTTLLTASHWASDWVDAAHLDVVRTDRPDVLEVVLEQDAEGQTLLVRGLAPGRAVLHLEQPGHESRLVLDRVIDVVDPALTYITSRYGNDAPAADGRMLLLANSRHTLVVERRDAGNEVLLGDTGGPWSISAGAAATIEAEGASGVLQEIVAVAPESVVVTSGDVSLPIDVVPASTVASLRVRVRERPHLVAEDGDTLRVPEAASFFFVIEAFDASGHVIAGSGGPGDLAVSDATTYDGPASGRGFTTRAVDHDVVVMLGGATMTVTLDYP